MKKLALLLAVLMSVSAFVSCGDTDDDDDKKSSSSYSDDDNSTKKDKKDSDEDEDESDNEDEEKSDNDDKKSDSSDKDQDETDDDESDNSVDSDDDEKTDYNDDEEEKTDSSSSANSGEFQRGIVDGNVYTSEYSAFQLTIPKGWSFMSDEDLLATMNIGLDITDTNLTAELLQQNVIYDAAATNVSTGESIMVMYENISKTTPDPDSFTVEDYYDAAFKNASLLMNGVTMTSDGKMESIDIDGTEYIKYVMDISYDDYGISMDQTYLGRKIDNFIFVITYTSGVDGGSISDYMNCFESIG